MKTLSIVPAIFMILFAMANGFSASSESVLGRSSFVAQRSQPIERASTYQKSSLEMMGGKVAKFGIFSPAVYGAKAILGTNDLNKLRGKAISLHSQAIGDFCAWAGAGHLRTRIIKKAKTNGDILGFLV